MSAIRLEPLNLAWVLGAMLRREMSVALRQKGEVLTPLVFFVVVGGVYVAVWYGRYRRSVK